MAHIANIRTRKRVRLFKKVRNGSSWTTLVVLLLLNGIFLASIIYFAGFYCQNLIESKFNEEYIALSNTAKLYECADEANGLLKYINNEDCEFIVKDNDGNVVFCKGKNTCCDEGGRLEFADGLEMTIYKDSEFGLFYVDEDQKLAIDFDESLQIIGMDDMDALNDGEGSFRLPFWISLSIKGDTQEFLGKAYFKINVEEFKTVLEFLVILIAVIFVAFVVMIVFLIRSIINNGRVATLFYTDPITGGHNWTWFSTFGEERVASRRYKKQSFAVVNLAFTNYRNFCMCHSIAEGEALLAKLDKLLSKQMKSGEMCARASTSGFAMLVFFVDEQSLRARLKQIMSTLQSIDESHNLVFQCGVDIIPVQTNNNDLIVRRLDVSFDKAYNNACTAVEVQGETDPSGVFIFDNKLLEEQRWYDTVQVNQSRALYNGEFEVYYQPKYDPKSLELRGAEALIRWNSPEYGFVSPGRFIPIFEKNGFITEIDHFMIRQVAIDQKTWLDKGYDIGCVSVNVSRAHFAENDLAEQIKGMVDAVGCPHELIEIELTESAFFDDQNAMINTIKTLKSYGFKVSMDDFGAGYSSLNSLKDMPLDVLKLDAGFFRGERGGERGEIVVAETIKLAKNLHMKTVAEGVEEKEQVEFLAKQGCDLIQGYYFATPMPKDEYTARLKWIEPAVKAAPLVTSEPLIPAAPAVPVAPAPAQNVVQAAPAAPVAPATPVVPAPAVQEVPAAPVVPVAPVAPAAPTAPAELVEPAAPADPTANPS